MADSENPLIEKKIERVQVAEAAVKQFIDAGGYLTSPEAMPLSVEFLHAFDELARESGYEILKPLDQTQDDTKPKEYAPGSPERKVEDILTLFTFSKKRDLENYSRELVIDSSAFVDIIFACESGQLPLLHRIHYQDHLPDHLQLLDEDHAAISENGLGMLGPRASKAFGKIMQTFRERRYLVGHIFYTPDLTEWHFFQFDQRDLEDRGNHWKEGSHIHFLNWLWPGYDAATLWQDFTTGRVKMGGSLHVRYFDAARARHKKIPGGNVF